MRFMTILLGLLCAAPGAQAAEEHAHFTEDLQAITITATPIHHNELEMSQPAQVLAGEELRRKLQSTLGETLSGELGVSSTQFGAGASRPIIRGLGDSRVKMLESGMSAMDAANLSPDHAVSIDPLAATQIEVLRGPATLLYGSGAIGGVVNVVTNRIASELPTQFTGQFASRYDTISNNRAGAFTLDGALHKFALHLDGSVRDADDYHASDGDEVTFSDAAANNLTGGASYIGGWGYLGFNIGHLATQYGIPGEGARIELKQLRYDIKGEITQRFLPNINKVKLQLAHNDYTHQELEPSGEVGTTFLNDEFDGRMELLHDPLAGWRGVWGVQINQRDFEAQGAEALTPPLTQLAAGLFALEERDFGDWHLELGARVENQRIDALDGSPSAEHLVVSLSGGTLWSFQPGYSAGVNFTRAQRAPSLEELYNNGAHIATGTFETGDVSLGEETAHNLDFSLRKISGDWTWRANVFVNYFTDFIFAQSVDADSDGLADRVDEEGNPVLDEDELLVINYAQENALFFGAELETTFALIKAAWGDVDGRLSADFVRGRLTNGDNLPRLPPYRLGAGLDYHHGNWAAALDARYNGEQTFNAPLETETDAYTLLDASVSYLHHTAPADFVFTVRGSNLLDEDARQHTSYLKEAAPLPGRSGLVEVRVSF